MESSFKQFISETSYEGAYVRLKSGKVPIYQDEAMTIPFELNDPTSKLYQVLYEYEQSTKLALKQSELELYVNKNDVQLMLFLHVDSQLNEIHLAYFDQKWKQVYLENQDEPFDYQVNDVGNLIANHLNILMAIQRKQQLNVVKKLLGDTIEKRQSIAQLMEQNNTLKDRYLKLRNSKLGKLQIKWWERLK
ncbi:hypothetical protein [Staphylococcus schleiferi]|uniref:hypothetical protein n=1 Tax=Staphylococcus schleiferi TaxID=1295 RepID=UPI0024800376|nr:hypothetical protein [Staphylococcus schleiferi]